MDVLEIAAVIESMGVTDPIAASTYAKDSVFALAEDAFSPIGDLTLHTQEHGSDDPQAESRERAPTATLDAAMSTLLTVLPLFIVVLSTRMLVSEGFSGRQTISVAVAVSSAMVAVTGPLLIVARQAAIYRGFGYFESAERFVRRIALELAAVAILLAGACSGLLLLAGLGVSFAVLFGVSFAGFSIIWILATSLIAARRLVACGASIAIGTGTGVTVFALQPPAAAPTGIATMAVCLAAALLTIRHHDGVLPVPSRLSLGLDGLPYAGYGLILMLLFGEPHVAAGIAGGSFRSFSIFELSFSLALVPFVVGAIPLQLMLYGFWGFVRQTERLLHPTEFAIVSTHLFRWKLLFFGGMLAVLTVMAAVIISSLRLHMALVNGADLRVVVEGLAGFWLFGCAQFASLLLLNFGRPHQVMKAAGAGVVVATTTSVLGALLGADLAALGFICGSAVLLVLATRAANSTLKDIDYHYASAF